jgi:predicted phage-related endonuclease
LQNEMELLKDEVTEYMTASDLMECNTKKYIIKLTPITKTYVDSKLLKSTHPKIYSSCCKQTTYTTLYIK